MRCHKLAVLALVVYLIGSVDSARAQNSIVDLGYDSDGGYPIDFNDSGQVLFSGGWLYDGTWKRVVPSDWDPIAFLPITELPELSDVIKASGYTTGIWLYAYHYGGVWADSLNDAGVVAGRLSFISDTLMLGEPFWLCGSLTYTYDGTLHILDCSDFYPADPWSGYWNYFDDYSAAYINNNRWVTGSRRALNVGWRSYLFRDGTMTYLDTLGVGRDINDSGWIVGAAPFSDVDSHPFLYRDGVVYDLGTLGGGSAGAIGINNSGQVVGISYTSSGARHGFLYDNDTGTMRDLGTLGGTGTRDWCEAGDINDLGQVVGWSCNANGDGRPFLYERGKMIDLNTLLPPNSGWVLDSVTAINNKGQIVGRGHLLGKSTNFLLSVEAKPTITITRTHKTRIPRTQCTYKTSVYGGWVTAITGQISYAYNGKTVSHPCWEAQDILPAGEYSGKLEPKGDHPAIHFVDKGLDAYYIHYRIGSEEAQNPWDDSTGKPWTTGCIVFNWSDELNGAFGADDSITINIVENYAPPGLDTNDYSISGVVNLSTGPAVDMRVVARQDGEYVAEGTTNSKGIYCIPGLVPGTYTVEPIAPTGFRGKGIRLDGVNESPLPWLSPSFKSDHVVTSTDGPPDCYGVSFLILPELALKVTVTPRATRGANGQIILDVKTTNIGGADATNVRISTATLGGKATTTPLGTQGQTVAMGASFSTVLEFPGTAGATGSRQGFAFKIVSDGGMVQGSVSVRLP